MIHLLDGNVLVALAVPSHLHNDTAHRWWGLHRSEPFATCPITQGTLLRLLLRENVETAQAQRTLDAICSLPNHRFWADDLAYSQVDMDGVLGHRQVTDAYLAQLARNRGGKLVTFDGGLAALHKDVAALVATD